MSFPWCVVLIPEVPGKPRGALLEEAKWPLNTRIKIGFMDGDAELQDRVYAVAEEWLTRTGARLFFERRSDPNDADIRISFRLRGSWSYLGRHALQIPKHKPTMNFGWLTKDSKDDAVREVVLHEFGHALGFVHEHQNPDGGMKWNREAVIASLSGPPNYWTVEEIEHNVLSSYDPREVLNTPFDPDSIMLYPFPAEWTQDGRSTKSNGDLSTDDIALARRIYG